MAEDVPRMTNGWRDALRADLAEMELRLRVYFDEQLKHKADAATVTALTLVLDRLSRGEFSDAQARAIDARIEAKIEEREGDTWSHKERVLATLASVIAASSLVVSTVIAFRVGYL